MPSCADEGRDWSDASMRKGMPEIAVNRQKLREAWNSPSLTSLKGTKPCQNPNLRLLASRPETTNVCHLNQFLVFPKAARADLYRPYLSIKGGTMAHQGQNRELSSHTN